jgi:hypothetical protein
MRGAACTRRPLCARGELTVSEIGAQIDKIQTLASRT